MDRILIDDHQLAKAMLIDGHVYEFCGKIERNRNLFLEWDTIELAQESGYRIDLILRLEELRKNYYEGRVSLRYWITETPKTAEELLDYTVKLQNGILRTKLEEREVVYSEYSRDLTYETSLQVGGHNLLKKLQKNEGKYLYMIVETGKLLD